jgi:hypothetical protein
MPARNGLLELLRGPQWQMSYGERASLEGVLARLQPRLAIEIGTAEGGSLERVAAHSEEVHAFDLSFELLERGERFDHVVFHAGDSHVLLPQVLVELERAGRKVDFALVDGDHSAAGVRQDVEDLLASEAVSDAVILLHDTMNETVRSGLRSVPYGRYRKVSYVELDFVPGYAFREPAQGSHLWGGLGLIVVEPGGGHAGTHFSRAGLHHDVHELMAGAQDTRLELERHREWLEAIQSSVSWRVTAPLRAAARGLRRVRGRLVRGRS